MPKHVMLDLETWSTKSNGTIISIGAVKFDPLDPTGLWDNFHVAIDPRAYKPLVGLLPVFHVDPDTIMWWMSDDQTTARQHWLNSQKLDLPTTLTGFAEWFGPESLPVWGNASTFDNVMLRHAYEACGMECPWRFWDDRCYRTVKNLQPNVKPPTDEEMRHILTPKGVPDDQWGVPHTALYDAQRQAIHLMELFDHMRPGEVPPLPDQSITAALTDPEMSPYSARDAGGHVVEDDFDF